MPWPLFPPPPVHFPNLNWQFVTSYNWVHSKSLRCVCVCVSIVCSFSFISDNGCCCCLCGRIDSIELIPMIFLIPFSFYASYRIVFCKHKHQHFIRSNLCDFYLTCSNLRHNSAFFPLLSTIYLIEFGMRTLLAISNEWIINGMKLITRFIVSALFLPKRVDRYQICSLRCDFSTKNKAIQWQKPLLIWANSQPSVLSVKFFENCANKRLHQLRLTFS